MNFWFFCRQSQRNLCGRGQTPHKKRPQGRRSEKLRPYRLRSKYGDESNPCSRVRILEYAGSAQECRPLCSHFRSIHRHGLYRRRERYSHNLGLNVQAGYVIASNHSFWRGAVKKESNDRQASARVPIRTAHARHYRYARVCVHSTQNQRSAPRMGFVRQESKLGQSSGLARGIHNHQQV